jgi:hypothetical protein
MRRFLQTLTGNRRPVQRDCVTADQKHQREGVSACLPLSDLIKDACIWCRTKRDIQQAIVARQDCATERIAAQVMPIL